MANGIADNLPPRVRTWLETMGALRGDLGISFAPDMDAVRQREADYAAYLGQTDYDKQLQESQSMAKLQLGLALAQRGFGSMGAQPRPGEMAISTVGRELLSPLAGDAMTVAQQMHQQKLARQQAQQQEDRQLKLAALQAVTSEDTARRSLATELTPKAIADTLNPTVHYVLREGKDKKWEFAPQTEDGRGRTQVRLQKGTGSPYDVQTQAPRPLLGGEIVVTAADVGKYIPEFDPSEDADKILDLGQVQQWVENGAGDVVLEDTVYETKAVYRDGQMMTVRADSGDPIEIGTAAGEYQLYEKPTAPIKPPGIDDPDFKATFAGFLAKLPGLRQDLDLGKRGLVFDPAKFNINLELKPGDNFPFSRLDKVPLTGTQQATYAGKLRTAYLNVFDSIKTGEVDREDLNKAFVQGFLDFSIENLGLPAAPTGIKRTREQITSPGDVTQAYKEGTEAFGINSNAEVTIQNMPFPKGTRNMTSGNGRLVLFDALGVGFGATTQAPPVLPEDATSTQIDGRAASVRSLDNRSIQDRIFAEDLAKGTLLGSRLRPSLANTREKQLVVVGDALENKQKTLELALADPAGKQIGETVGKTLDTIAFLDYLDAKMKLSGLPGFVLGPLEVFARGRFGVNIGAWLRTDEGQDAANELMANLPLLQEFIARELLKGTGEQRISTPDLRGAQKTLININKSGKFNEDQLRALRGYLVSSVTHSLEYVGAYGLPERTLEKAAQLGIDVKSIKGRNGFYSPYLEDRNYAVTKHPVPSYSKEYQTQLRDTSIFGYVTRSGGTGQEKQYQLIVVDENNQPIWDDEIKKYATVLIPATSGWQTSVSQSMLDFNRNFLMKTYKLDR